MASLRWRLLAYRFKQLGTGVFRDVTGDGERTVSARTFSVDTALGNVFTVEVREFFDEMEIVEKQRTAWAGGTGILVVSDWRATGGCKRLGLAHAVFFLCQS